ncbi:MAG: class I SAM-dependent methyltransferase [Candidatus Aenigmatarchaeota archaeon]
MDGAKQLNWDIYFQRKSNHHLNKYIAKYKGKETEKLIKKWLTNINQAKVLKTDAYEEVFLYDSFIKNISNITIIDISKVAIKKAKKNFPDKKFEVSNICNLPFKNNCFEYIISTSTLDNIPMKRMKIALKEMYRVLKSKGYLLITIDNKNNFLYYLFYNLNKILKFIPYYQDRCYSLYEITKLLNFYGFKIKKIDYIVHIIPPSNFIINILDKLNKNIAKILAEFLINIAEFISKKPIKSLTGWFIAILAEK